jgi:hypothetical protein
MKKPTRKIQSVYRNQNALVRAVFERAGDARKVLCVALDYAKLKHVALICDGQGDVLKASFPVENNAAGVAHLIKEISSTARRRKIPTNQTFLGGEDEPAYVANFTEALRAKDYLVVRVNAYEAKENRENLLASTDTLDLLGIAKTLLSKPFSRAAPAPPAAHPPMPPSIIICARSPVAAAPSFASKPPPPTASTPLPTSSFPASSTAPKAP